MAGFTRFTGFSVDWTAKATKISGQATNFKTWLNTRTAELLTWLEDFLAELEATTDSASGADKVGMTAITEAGAGTTVQAVVEGLVTRLKAVTNSASGADLVGATAITQTGAAATVQAILEALAPMTTEGDITYQGASAPARLAKGDDGQVLTLASGVPIWADASGGAETWTAVDSFTRASDSSYTVTDNAANQAIHCKGRPIRYADTAGTYSYGIITGYTTGTVTLAGAPMTTSFDAILEYGDFTRVVPLEVMIPSSFAVAGASSTLINTVLKADLAWRMGKAYLVRFLHIVDADDSGANQTRVNVNVAGSAAGTANTNAGPAIAETWVATTTDINTSNYDINFGEAIEITCDANGTNDDARDLTVSMTFVLA